MILIFNRKAIDISTIRKSSQPQMIERLMCYDFQIANSTNGDTEGHTYCEYMMARRPWK